MKLSMYFKSAPMMQFDNVKHFGLTGHNENVLRIDLKDDRTYFINFSEVVACVEEKEESE